MENKKILINPVPKELIDKFIRKICTDSCKEMNKNSNYNNVDGIKKIIIFTDNNEESEKIHNMLIKKCSFELGDFIELETGVNRINWNRSITLFESVVEQNNVTLYW